MQLPLFVNTWMGLVAFLEEEQGLSSAEALEYVFSKPVGFFKGFIWPEG